MSYTPPDEQIDAPLEQCFEALEDLRKPMLARLRGEGWNDEHKAILREAIAQLTELQVTLTRLR